MSRFNIFETIQLPKPRRAKFDLSHSRKMSIPFGALIPVCVLEVLPGDSFKKNTNVLGRFQALLAPPMHQVDVTLHEYYVPYKVLSENWTRFINYQGNRPNLSQNASEAPYFNLSHARSANVNGAVGNALKDGSLLDYLGFPTAPNDVGILPAVAAWYDNLRFSALLPLAYQRIWSDHYRDQNYTRPMFYGDGDGQSNTSSATAYFDQVTQFGDAVVCPDYETTNNATTSFFATQLLTLRWRAWQKDYLTTAQPYANQGIADARVPITIPASSLGNLPAAGSPYPAADVSIGKTGGIQYPGALNNPTDLGSFTMSAMRVASALKRWFEASARGGIRYGEMLWNHWFVKSSDESLFRSVYLGGSVMPMVTSEVLSQAPATADQDIPPGYMAGHGVAYGNTSGFMRRFEDHGVVMTIASVLPRTAYLYSMPRAFMRSEPLDFAWPEFAQIGEQGVLGSEVFFKLQGTAASVSAPNYTNAAPVQTYAGVVTRFPMGYAGASYQGFDLQNDRQETSVTGGSVWGFQGRYAEYKYQPDTVHGLFRNNQSFWHFARMLSPGALLNNAFVTSNPRMDPFAVLPSNGGAAAQYNQHPINLHVYNSVSVVRSLPYYNTPTLW